MPVSISTILDNPSARAAIEQAWLDSQPGITGGHEEGGFILQDETGKMSVARWPAGAQDAIRMPPHPNCRIGDDDIVATFHTHPNIGLDYLQEPSETDLCAVRDDPDLKGAEYVGELVISAEIIYLVTPTGQTRVVGATNDILFPSEGV
jgi:hypothetical protein